MRRLYTAMPAPGIGARSAYNVPASQTGTGAPVANGADVLRERMVRMSHQTLDEIEAGRSGAGVRTAAERERDTRTMGAIMKILEKLNDKEIAPKGDQRPSWMSRDDEDICRDLSREIDRFRRSRKARTSGVSKS
ncbi:MAG: hypothetical protein ACR2OR_15270 [Hyphomicrobiales bacterium]